MTKEPWQADFFQYHRSLAAELDAVKDRIHTLIQHRLTDGAFKEAALRSVLRRHLPESLMVAHGFVVREQETSTEIDILIIDRDRPTLFKDGDLVIVSADAVRAMIEVKTNLDGPSKVEEALVKLCSNNRVCFNAGQARRIWTGLFVYNGRDDRDEVLLRSLQAAWEQTTMEAKGPQKINRYKRGRIRYDTRMSKAEELERKYALLFPHLNERQQDLIAAFDGQRLGRGGITIVSRVTGFSRPTIYRAIESLSQRPLPVERVRHSGAGRKTLVHHDPQLVQALEALVDPDTRGDPMSPLRWTCKSTRVLARLLTAQGHPVSYMTVAQLLHDLHYSLQGNAKTKEGKQHPDRDAQFRYIQRQGESFLSRGWPVISVDTKKKELIGNYEKSGQEWQPEGQPIEVDVHDFPDLDIPKAVPRGVYDQQRNEGWVTVGCSHDTSSFAVESIRRWWREMGHPLYPEAEEV